jgi:DNA-binding NarL/FixJ family response regulator
VPNRITVAIVDDNRLVREALAAMLSQETDMAVVTTEAATPAFLDATPAHVVLLDVGLADEDSMQVAALIRQHAPSTRIIVMDLIPVNEDIAEFVRIGVSGFILKDASFEEFVATIRSVAVGMKVLPSGMTDSLFSQISARRVGGPLSRQVDAVRMTRREHEVIGLIGEGLSNKEIASHLNIATHTVKSHVRNVMEKLTLHTRLQIAAYSHREGQS